MIFAILGIVLIVLGFMLLKNNDFKMQVISTEAVISSVQTSTASDGSVINKVLNVSYNANRSDYSAVINDPSSTLVVGDKMTLYYDIFTPTSVNIVRSGYQGYAALLLGIILILKNGSRFYRMIRDNYILSS